MKKHLLCLAACFVISFSFAQSTAPEIISPAGTSFNNGTSQLDWTLGEPVTLTYTSGSDILTQGFHQPNLTITALDDTHSIQSIQVFPNPVTEYVQISFSKSEKKSFIIELHSSDGRLLETNKKGTDPETQINMSPYKAGVYLLSVKEDGSKTKTYRIVKSH
ncbi:MAG: hypothetical protein K0S44_1397 [Bacteroidetes bacterium]|jgi:hypothetical protein|nr:hypothetical protein [Bacteroidota bacterium]